MYLISVHSIAMNLSNVIAQELNFDNVQKAKISYGLEAILGMLIKFIVYIIMFLGFGVLRQSLIAMFTFALLRYASGGMHCKTFIKCLVLSVILFLSIGIIAKSIVINNYLYYILNIVSFIIIILRAPIDPPEKPIKTKQKRYAMKSVSILIILLLIFVSNHVNANDIKNSILLGMYSQILTLTSLDKLINNYINRLKLKLKEVY